MFLKYGYKPLVIASDGFIPRDYFAKCDLKFLPSVEKSDSYKNDANFDSDIKMLAETMEKHLKDVDVVISHDLIYLPDYTKYNLAARMVAEKLPKLRWLHFIHSATPPDIIGRAREIYGDKYFEIVGKPFPNSFIAFPNVYDIPRVAKNFGFAESDVKHIPHPIDYCEYNKFHDIS